MCKYQDQWAKEDAGCGVYYTSSWGRLRKATLPIISTVAHCLRVWLGDDPSTTAPVVDWRPGVTGVVQRDVGSAWPPALPVHQLDTFTLFPRWCLVSYPTEPLPTPPVA